MSAPAPASPPSRSDRPLILVFAVMLALTLWFTTRAWDAPILDRHEFRQTQTAISAFWIKEAGYHLDFETPIFGPPWSIPLEFPVYQWVVATTSRLLGLGLESTARGVSLFFFLATLPAVYGLAGLLNLAPSRRLLVVSTVLASPTYLFYARSFMIETTALCCATWFLYTITRAVRDNRGWFAVWAAVFAVLAGLTKITTFAVFLPPAALLTWLYWQPRWANRVKQPATCWRVTGLAIAPVVLGLVIAYWWVRHGDGLKRMNPFAGFLVSAESAGWVRGTWAQRVSAEFWAENWRNISSMVLGAVPLAVLALGATVVDPVYRRIAAWGAGFFLGALLLFANLYYFHDYYYCASAVFLLGGAGVLLAGIWDSPRLPALTKWLALLLVLGGQFELYYFSYGSYQRRELPAPPAIAAVTRAVVARDKVVVIYGWDWNTLVPYYAERRVIMVPRGREPETKVLDEILRRVPSDQIAALIIRNDETLRASPEFIRERLNRFRLASAPFASSPDGDLYLPEEEIAAAAAKVSGRGFNGATLHTQPPVDSYAGKLHETDLGTVDWSVTSPRPSAARSLFGVSLGSDAGRKIILAHPVSELHFNSPPGATRIDAEVGLADGAFAPENPSPSDGVTVEIFESRANGLRRSLYRRDLDPAKAAGDRGPQAIHLDNLGPMTGTVIFKITPGPKNNLTSDWAYWGRIEVR